MTKLELEIIRYAESFRPRTMHNAKALLEEAEGLAEFLQSVDQYDPAQLRLF